MTKYSVERITTRKPFTLSRLGLSHYLRLGFLPAPLSVYANELVINNYHGAFHDWLDPASGQFTRDLRQFVGTRRREAARDFNEAAACDAVRATLLESTARAIEGYDHVFLMVSGGKDSVSVAWALHELNRPATLIHCTNRGRENESPEVQRLADMLGFECLLLSDDIQAVDSFFRQNVHKLPIPMGDPAFFAYLRAVREIGTILDRAGQKNAVVLDGMGNDAYMGHVPPLREKWLLRLPRFPFLSESFTFLIYGHGVTHYALGTLFKRREERHFSGAFFAIDRGPIAPDLSEIFSRYSPHPEERRALIRGGISDVDAGMRKGILAATLDSRIDVAFPFFHPRWVELYETFPETEMFDYSASLNKKILRTMLKQNGVVSDYVFSKKGSFRFNLDELSALYTPSQELREIAKALGISGNAIGNLTSASRSSFVAAQKLGVLYVLDNFLQARGIPKDFAEYEVNQITYTD